MRIEDINIDAPKAMMRLLKRFIRISIVILIIFRLVSAFLDYDDQKFFQSNVLMIRALPESLRFIDRATYAWTDYREEYAVTVDSQQKDLIFSGRDYSACIEYKLDTSDAGENTNKKKFVIVNMDLKGKTSRTVSAGLEEHIPFPVASCVV
ncbi:hypothetical protein [Spongorhabdus nitratireducens]